MARSWEHALCILTARQRPCCLADPGPSCGETVASCLLWPRGPSLIVLYSWRPAHSQDLTSSSAHAHVLPLSLSTCTRPLPPLSPILPYAHSEKRTCFGVFFLSFFFSLPPILLWAWAFIGSSIIFGRFTKRCRHDDFLPRGGRGQRAKGGVYGIAEALKDAGVVYVVFCHFRIFANICTVMHCVHPDRVSAERYLHFFSKILKIHYRPTLVSGIN